jgi:phospholipase/carboxylesterase/glyoxalase family protein
VSDELGFIHRWVPGEAGASLPTLLLLHGTGGNESDLLNLGPMLLPGANVLSPRGKVSENGAPRFFRRLAEGVFDVEDLIARTHELADFVGAAADQYGFDAGNVIAIGYSNGANIASSMMLLRPGTLAGGILLRPMVPLEPDTAPNLTGLPVYLGAGQLDPIVPVDDVSRLAELLEGYGASVNLTWQPAGHNLTREDVLSAREWLDGVVTRDA